MLGNKEIDITQTIMGMDPLIMMGLATIASGAAGWLVGPAIGGAAFNVVKSRYRQQIAQVSFFRPYERTNKGPFRYVQRMNADEDDVYIAREGIPDPDQEEPCRPELTECEQPGPGLLRREDWKRTGLSSVVEGPAGVQAEEGEVFVSVGS